MTAGQIDTAIGNPPEIMCPGDDPYSMSIKLKKVCLQMALSTKSLCPSSVYESVYQTILSISESICICSALIGGGAYWPSC